MATCRPLVPPQQHYDSISSHPLDAVLWKMTVIWLRWFEASGSLPLLGPRCTATLKRDWSVNVWLAIKWQSHTEGFFYRRTCFVPNSSQSRLIQIWHFKWKPPERRRLLKSLPKSFNFVSFYVAWVNEIRITTWNSERHHVIVFWRLLSSDGGVWLPLMVSHTVNSQCIIVLDVPGCSRHWLSQ